MTAKETRICDVRLTKFPLLTFIDKLVPRNREQQMPARSAVDMGINIWSFCKLFRISINSAVYLMSLLLFLTRSVSLTH